jgi:hypothetical protein
VPYNYLYGKTVAGIIFAEEIREAKNQEELKTRR